MTTAELVRYMQQLDLSAQQQLAVTTMHDDYKRSYATLYESEIEPFLEEMRGLSGMSMPERDELERIIRGLRTLEGRIRTLDNGLFDQMQTLLTDEQLVNMPRVRLARLRACYNQQQLLQMWTMGSPIIDVSATVFDLKLPAEHMLMIDPTLSRYESNITGRIGRLHDGATTLWLDIFDAIETAGFDPEMFEDMENADPEEMRKFIEFMQQTFMQMTVKGREEVGRIHDTNRQTVRSMRGVVPEEVYRTIRNAYFFRAYPNVPAIALNTPAGPSALDDINDLSPEKRAAATDAINLAMAELDAIIEAVADKADAFRREINPMDWDNEKYQKHNEAMTELQKQANAITEKLLAQLQELFTEEQWAAWQQRVAADTKRLSPSMAGAVDDKDEVVAAEGEADEFENEQLFGPDEFLPPRIGQRDLTLYLALLEATDEQQAIIRELYDNYVAGFDALEQSKIKELSDKRSEIWRYDEHGERTATVEQIQDIYAGRRTLLETIAELDRRFFDDVQLLFADEQSAGRVMRVRQLRARQSFNRPIVTRNTFGFGRGDSESRVDAVEFLARQKLSPEALAALEPTLAQYEQQVMPLVRQRYDHAMKLQQTQEVWNLRWQEIQKEEGSAAASATLMAEYQDTIGSAQDSVNEVDDQISRLNSAIMQQAVAALPADNAAVVRDKYHRLAFPTVYLDGAAVKKHLDKSMELDDLSGEQRAALIDLRAEYGPSYDALCDRMLTLTRESPVRTNSFDEEDWAAFTEYHDKLQRLQFERSELNSRALLRLRALLSEAQIESIGGLPEVAKRDDEQAVMW